jgi:Holin of 3TMs, for gene-transfer release
MDLLGIGSIIQGVGQVAEHFVTTDKERMELEIESRKLDQANDMAQIGVNTEEAKSASLFVSGWRPAVGWICGFGLLYVSVFLPIAEFTAKINGYAGSFPEVDTSITMQVLFGMLGLSGMRTYEKTKGVASK